MSRLCIVSTRGVSTYSISTSVSTVLLVLLVLLVLVLCHVGALLVSPLFVANPPCPLSWHHLVKSRIRYNPPFQPAL